MMEPLSTWENILLGALVLLVIFWMSPGISASIKQSKAAESDWKSFFIVIALVMLFIVFLIKMV